MAVTAPVAPGWWWVRTPSGMKHDIVLVEGDYPTPSEQIVNIAGAGFCSVAKFKAQGFVFLQPVTAIEETR